MPGYILSTFFTQMSILACAYRIVNQASFSRLSRIVWLGFWHWLIWLPTTLSVFLTQCLPVKSNYDLNLRFDPGTKCKNYVPAYITVATVHMLVDFAILAVPVILVLRLQVPVRKKWTAILLASISFLAASCSVFRAAFAVMYAKSADVTFTASWIALCSQLEISLAIIASSLPRLRRLFSGSTPTFRASVSTGAYLNKKWLRIGKKTREKPGVDERNCAFKGDDELAAKSESWLARGDHIELVV
ncbi:hypothetical protein ACJ41O_010933 [Fusarium nematophilum]